MRFVHVEDFIHPDAGYQVNLLSKLQQEQGHEVIIITAELEKVPTFLTSFFGKDNIKAKDKAFEKRTGVKIIRHPLYGFYSGRAIFKPGLHRIIKAQQPDVLFIHGEDTLTGMKLLWSYKDMNVPYVLDCHMLEMASVNVFKNQFRKFFRTFVTPIILKNDIPLIRVVDSDFVQKHFNIPLERTKLLSFGTDTSFYKPDIVCKKKYREDYNIKEDDFLVLYAGKLDVYKGGQFLADALEAKIHLDGKNLVLLIIGTPPENDYGNLVESTLSKSENVIIRLPTQTYADLAKFYQMADIAVYPKQCSMSYYEAQSSGLPVVLEENEINVDRVSNKKGIIFKAENQSDFREAIIQFGNMPKDEFIQYQANSRQNILEKYNFLPIAQKFTDVMIEQYKKFHGINV